MIRISNVNYGHFLGQASLLRRAGSMCDAVISVKGQKFEAHRLVLACASRVLARQLALGDSDPFLCSVDYVSSRTFQQVLDFAYSREVEVSPADLRLLLRAAHHLEMPQLLDQCCGHLDLQRHGPEGDQREVHDREEDAGPDDTSMQEKTRHVFSSEKPKDSSQERVVAPSYFGPAWTLSPGTWNSMSTLRQMTQSYSDLVVGCPLPTPNMTPVVHPVTLPSSFHLLTPYFRPSAQQGSRFGSHHAPDPQGTPVTGRSLKQRLLTRERPRRGSTTGTDQNDELSTHREEAQPRRGVKECPRCGDPPSAGASFAGGGSPECTLCRRIKQRQRRASEKQQQDPSGVKPHQCQHCPKTFSLKHQLDTHHRIHTGEKPFQCRLCGHRSRDYSAMIKHLRTHGGAAPYRCTACLEFCSSLVAMQRHVKSHAVQDFPPDWSISSTYLFSSHH